MAKLVTLFFSIMNFLWNVCTGCTGVEKSACARVYSALTCAPLRLEEPLLAPEISLKVNMDSTLA